jgi:hypothetical protein
MFETYPYFPEQIPVWRRMAGAGGSGQSLGLNGSGVCLPYRRFRNDFQKDFAVVADLRSGLEMGKCSPGKGSCPARTRGFENPVMVYPKKVPTLTISIPS